MRLRGTLPTVVDTPRQPPVQDDGAALQGGAAALQNDRSTKVSRRWHWRLLALVLMLLGIALLLRATALPSLGDRHESRAELQTADTRLGRSITPRTSVHPGFTAIRALSDAQEAFAARVPVRSCRQM